VADVDSALQYRTDGRLAASLVAGDSLPERLRSLVERVDGRIVLTNGFGIEGQLIAHHIFTGKLPIEVVTIDTGRLFPETHDLWQRTEERYGVRIRAIHPEPEAVTDMVADSGVNGFLYSRDSRLACCGVRKVAPLGRALAGASAWVTGLRADQSRARSTVKLVDWDAQRGLIKFAPLFDRSREWVAAECERLGVPVSDLHQRGFASVGCQPCTRAIAPGEPERAGRWWWETDGNGECGIHVLDDGLKRSKAA
jgi:phosphoadenosine phosphosulfate reductase